MAPLPIHCTDCGGLILGQPIDWHDQYQVDLPPPKPSVTRFRIPAVACPRCGRRVQGRHPDQTSDAVEAAAVQLGPHLLALAADLKHRLGLSYRKAAEVIRTLTGEAVSPGGMARSGRRLRELARPTYQSLVEHIRAAPAKHVDETGWRVGGRSA